MKTKLSSRLKFLSGSVILFVASNTLATPAPLNSAKLWCRAIFLDVNTAYQKFGNLSIYNEQHRQGQSLEPQVDLSFSTEIPVVRSLEKEGLYYEEIAPWFSVLRSQGKQKLEKRFLDEQQGRLNKSILTAWLQRVKVKGPATHLQFWAKANVNEKMVFLLKMENPFDFLSVNDRSFLFENDILNFNDVTGNAVTPNLVTVGDDLGSYEVRLSRGVTDRNQFHELRDEVEKFLEGKIGHQHLFHAWPEQRGLRQELAPYYIELLDSTTWYLYWRQMARNPEEVSSVMTHPFLGVYTKASLSRLEKAYVQNEPKKFKDKYRMIGARNFPASVDIPEQGTGLVPDWELRSGNKGVKREFVENLILARLTTGDFVGLKRYDSYDFNPSASVREILTPLLKHGISESDIQLIEQFEKEHPKMRWSSHGRANNHFRNRIMSPLFPWQNRLTLEFKKELIEKAQIDYARGLIAVARDYFRDKDSTNEVQPLRERRQNAIDSLEILIFEFATQARLDLDFERYLKPVPNFVPDINIANQGGPIDINKMDLGIEYSFRMPYELSPKSQSEAAANIKGLAQEFLKNEGSIGIDEAGAEGHGHGIAVKYKVQDRDQQSWRFEWDGIQRSYDQAGKVTKAWGGHIEVVTPKFSPKDIQGQIGDLFHTARERGLVPRRSAGGAHVNFDLVELMNHFPPEEGTRRLINFLSYFESSEPLILFLWQHPLRRHAAYPITVNEAASKRLFDFNGNWRDLGKLLYEIRYFNIFKGRKPKYVPLNLTSLMTPIVPDNYIEKTLDIRSPVQEWFPNFNKVSGRGEARFFDAPLDENMAALQIKYFRALLSRGLNAQGKIPLVQRYSASDVDAWKTDVEVWILAVENHLIELGLDPKEFKTLIWDSWMNQSSFEPSAKKLEAFTDFEPPKK